MSVIVTEMDIPEDCVSCDFKVDAIGNIYCGITGSQVPVTCAYYERMKDCPLKSEEGLIEKLEKIGGDEEKSIYKNLNPSYVQGLKDTIKTIKEYCEVK